VDILERRRLSLLLPLEADDAADLGAGDGQDLDADVGVEGVGGEARLDDVLHRHPERLPAFRDAPAFHRQDPVSKALATMRRGPPRARSGGGSSGPAGRREERAVRLDGDLSLVEEDGRVRFREWSGTLNRAAAASQSGTSAAPAWTKGNARRMTAPSTASRRNIPFPAGIIERSKRDVNGRDPPSRLCAHPHHPH